MISSKTDFRSLIDKYLVYSETVSQHNRLNAEDRRVLLPYLNHLRTQWQAEFKRITEALQPARTKTRLRAAVETSIVVTT